MQHPENKDQKGKSENYICAKLHSYLLADSFCCVKYGLSIITSKVSQIISVIKTLMFLTHTVILPDWTLKNGASLILPSSIARNS